MAVEITLSDLRAKVEAGWKKPQLAEHYGLPQAQVGKLLKQAGLTIRKFHQPKFALVDDTNAEHDLVASDNEVLDVVDMENATYEVVQESEAESIGTQVEEVVEPIEGNTGNW
jgi:hypothetical protein